MAQIDVGAFAPSDPAASAQEKAALDASSTELVNSYQPTVRDGRSGPQWFVYSWKNEDVLALDPVTPPPDAPAVALAGVGAGLVTTGAHKYKLAWTGDGTTSAAGAASATVTTNTTTNGKVLVTIPALPDDSRVTGVALYRTAAGGSTYYQMDVSLTPGEVYTDNVADASLLETEAPTADTIVTTEAELLLARLPLGAKIHEMFAVWSSATAPEGAALAGSFVQSGSSRLSMADLLSSAQSVVSRAGSVLLFSTTSFSLGFSYTPASGDSLRDVQGCYGQAGLLVSFPLTESGWDELPDLQGD